MSEESATIQCVDCRRPIQRLAKATSLKRCEACQAVHEREVKYEHAKVARFNARRLCPDCRLVRLPKGTSLCAGCSVARNPDWAQNRAYELARKLRRKPRGVWQLGPVVFDWSGNFGAWRCEEHGAVGGITFELSDDDLKRHALVWHNLQLKEAVEIPEIRARDLCPRCRVRPAGPRRPDGSRLCAACRFFAARERAAALRVTAYGDAA